MSLDTEQRKTLHRLRGDTTTLAIGNMNAYYKFAVTCVPRGSRLLEYLANFSDEEQAKAFLKECIEFVEQDLIDKTRYTGAS